MTMVNEPETMDRYQFTCPVCGTTPVVDEQIREDILGFGCYICGAVPTEGDFQYI